MAASPAALALTLAKRERRGSQRTFVAAGIAMVLAVAILTTVLCVTDSLRSSLRSDTKSLLGGDLEIKLVTRGFNGEELEWIGQNTSRNSLVKTTRAIALTETSQQLIYFKAVDSAYPLLGKLELEGQDYSDSLLDALSGEIFPAIVSPELKGLLGLDVGDEFQVGSATLRVAGFIAKEPDPNTRIWVVAPPVIVSQEAFAQSNLELPGSIVRRRARVLFAEGVDEEGFLAQLKERFPDANWEIEDHKSVLSNLSRILNRLETFLTLASLGTILIAGIGIGNTVSTFLATRLTTIATLKSLGGTSALVRRLYLIQIGVICVLGALAGALAGAGVTMLIVPVISEYLPLEVSARIGFGTLVTATFYALMSALVFSLPPLYRYSLTNPTLLFSPVSTIAAYEPVKLPAAGRIVPGGVAILLLCLLYYTSTDLRIFRWTVGGGMLALVLFTLLSHLLSRVAAMVNPKALAAKLAFRSIARSPIQLRIGMVSFGVALAALTSLLLTQSNLDSQLDNDLEGKSPSFYMIGIQAYQRDDIVLSSLEVGSLSKIVMLPFIRGRFTKLAGVPVEEIEEPEEYGWVLNNDRGITWVEEMDRTGVSTARELVSEKWIESSSASGGLEVSFDEGAAEAFGLGIGDTISFVIDEKERQATITELRPINWRDLQINFVMIFSHSQWPDVPSGYLGGARMDKSDEAAYQRSIAQNYPNVTLISTSAIFATARRLIGNVNAIINSITLVAVLTSLLVIGTTVMQGQQMRTVQLIIMRVLGARSSKLRSIFCIEFVVMAALATIPALLLGALCAFFVITELFDLTWTMDLPSAALIAGAMVAISIGGGLASMQSSLRQSPLKYLRNE